MKAAIVDLPGRHGELRDVADPMPGDREILVSINIAGINPVDWKLRDLYDRPAPFTLGQDFAGTVVATGAHVSEYAYGDRVFGIAREHGAYAELTVAPVDDRTQPIANIPAAVGDADAAGLPTPGLTALACIERIKITPQMRVLILGITGGVGRIAAQLALARGARVTGVGRQAQEAEIRELGVHAYVGYDDPEFSTAMRRAAEGGFEAVIDVVSEADTIADSRRYVRAGGLLISTNRAVEEGAFAGAKFTAENVNLDGSPSSSHDGLRTLIKMVEAGTLKVPIVAERDLRDSVAALDMVKAGKIGGKVLITVERSALSN